MVTALFLRPFLPRKSRPKVKVETIQKRLQRSQEGIFSEKVYWQHEQFTRELFSEKEILEFPSAELP